MTGCDLRQAIATACPGSPFFAGVACSTLAGLFASLEKCILLATSEGEALAISTQSRTTGRQPVCLLQNSGLGNLVNPYMSMTRLHGVPVLFIIGWRGKPGTEDEPQHMAMGALTIPLLREMGIAVEDLSETSALARIAARTRATLMEGTSVAWLVHEGDLAKPASPPIAGHGAALSRADVLAQVVESVPHNAILVAGTGKCGRELYTLADREGSLYVVGAMGYAGAIGLGLAQAWPTSTVIVLDGDAACLMHMGCLATIGQSGARNLVHVVLDNGGNDSTGGQPSLSPSIDLCAIALGCGYEAAIEMETGRQVAAIASRQGRSGPAFARIRIKMGSMHPLGRPALHPSEVISRLTHHLLTHRMPENA